MTAMSSSFPPETERGSESALRPPHTGLWIPRVAAVLLACLLAPLPATAGQRLTVSPAGITTWGQMRESEAFLPRRPPRVVAIYAGPGERRMHAPPHAPQPGPSPPPAVTATQALMQAQGFLALPDHNTVIPPDTMGAAGPQHLMTMLNSQVRIQNKTGGTVSTVSLATFWTAGTGLSGGPFDPHVVYDSLSGRWMAAVFANAATVKSQVWFAISATSDPDRDVELLQLRRHDERYGAVGGLPCPRNQFDLDRHHRQHVLGHRLQLQRSRRCG